MSINWIRFPTALALCAAASLAPSCLAQEAVAEEVAEAEPAARGINEARVTEVLQLLASDRMAGRDSPSPQLEEAKEWLIQQFRAAGLQPLPADSAGYSHNYSLEGSVLDSKGIAVTLHPAGGDDVVLVPDDDVRWWRGGRAMELERGEVVVARQSGDVDPRLMRNGFGRKPLVLAAADDDPLWRAAEGRHGFLRGPRAGSQPVLLVRAGKLPAGEFTASVRLPAPVVEGIPLANVVGVLPGTTRKDEYVIVSAHYDHVGVSFAGGEDGIYNGADDNATGTTGVVCLAEELAAMDPSERPERSVLFVCFSAEEKGLRGSRAFAADPPIDLSKAVANLNLEMLGRPSDGKREQAWVTGADLSDFATIVTTAMIRAGVEVVEFEMASRLFFASDNFPLAQAGVVAHSVSAGSLHADYHKPTDEFDRIDVAHMTKVIAGLKEAVLDLANGEQVPQWNERGEKALKGRGR